MLSSDVIKYHILPFVSYEDLYKSRYVNGSFYRAYRCTIGGLSKTLSGKVQILAIALQDQDQELFRLLFKSATEIKENFCSAIYRGFVIFDKRSKQIITHITWMLCHSLWNGRHLEAIPKIVLYGKKFTYYRLPLDLPSMVHKTIEHVTHDPFYLQRPTVQDSLVSLICVELSSVFGYRYIADILEHNPGRFSEIFSKVRTFRDPFIAGYLLDCYLKIPTSTNRSLELSNLFSNPQFRQRLVEALNVTADM